MSANTAGAGLLARACRTNAIPLVTFSSDLVFDGFLGRPYLESDIPNPSGVYGQSKLIAERLAAAIGGETLIVRTSAFFGPWDRFNFVWQVLEHLREGRPFGASTDVVSPTFIPDLCHAVLDLLIDGETGIWHLANASAISWYELARTVADWTGHDRSLIFACDVPGRRNTALASSRAALLRPLDSALGDYLRDVTAEPPPSGEDPILHSAAAISAT
jgi:dTDP-4-dehydrorhamnose reductase